MRRYRGHALIGRASCNDENAYTRKDVRGLKRRKEASVRERVVITRPRRLKGKNKGRGESADASEFRGGSILGLCKPRGRTSTRKRATYGTPKDYSIGGGGDLLNRANSSASGWR